MTWNWFVEPKAVLLNWIQSIINSWWLHLPCHRRCARLHHTASHRRCARFSQKVCTFAPHSLSQKVGHNHSMPSVLRLRAMANSSQDDDNFQYLHFNILLPSDPGLMCIIHTLSLRTHQMLLPQITHTANHRWGDMHWHSHSLVTSFSKPLTLKFLSPPSQFSYP